MISLENINTKMEHSIEENAVEEEEETHIHRLPIELLVFIFNKLLDAKCLCRCYLVSKRFASIIPQTHDVSFTLPKCKIPISNHQNDEHSEGSFRKNVLNFFVKTIYAKPVHYFRNIFGPKPALSATFDPIAFSATVQFLRKFKDIKSLHVELPSFHKNSSLLKWEAKFRKELSSCVVLFATSFRRRKFGESEADIQSVSLTNELLRSRVNSAMRRFMDALWRNHILQHIMQDHNTLQNVIITDSEKEGALCLGEKEIADFHDSVSSFPTSGYVKICHAPGLNLLTSQHVMEGASLIMIRLFHQQSGDEDAVMERIFKGDEVFKEAARDIYEGHKAEALTFMIELDLP